jgi:hypothetical protein
MSVYRYVDMGIDLLRSEVSGSGGPLAGTVVLARVGSVVRANIGVVRCRCIYSVYGV